MSKEMELHAKRLGELGNLTRLSIFRVLVKAGRKGVAVGDVQKILDIPGSTLSHHISRMVNAGLVEQRRESRTLYCLPLMDAVKETADFLLSECCSGNIVPK